MPSKVSSRSSSARRPSGKAVAPHRPGKGAGGKAVKKTAARPQARVQAKVRPSGKPQPAALKAKLSAQVKAAQKAPANPPAKPEQVRAVKPQSPPAPPAAPVVAAPLAATEAPVIEARKPVPSPAAALPARPAALPVGGSVAVLVTGAPPARPPAESRPPAELRRVPAAPAPRGFPTHLARPGAGGGPPGSRPMVGLPPRPLAPAETFVEGDHVVYPTHGVGKIERIVTENIAGYRLELIHITFEENRMTLRVPVEKARTAGLRKLASRQLFDAALTTLRGRARIKRTMWSRRAQEYEAKINSGDPLAIAEVVRDLHRNAGQPDQSFSERQIYEAAMDRLAAELAALDNTDKATATEKLTTFMKAA